MGVGLSQRLVPDELWSLVAPLLPSFPSRPQGGGTAPVDERARYNTLANAAAQDNDRRLASQHLALAETAIGRPQTGPTDSWAAH